MDICFWEDPCGFSVEDGRAPELGPTETQGGRRKVDESEGSGEPALRVSALPEPSARFTPLPF